MKATKALLIVMAFMACLAQAAPAINPTYKEVNLSEFTSLSLDILPDAGTQLIFPFILDSPDLSPPLKYKLTNSSGFALAKDPSDLMKEVAGQNTLSIIGLAAPGQLNPVYIGNLFLSVNGYNITIALRTTYDPSQHVTNVVFKIPDDKREFLVDKAAERKIAVMQRNYDEKMKRLDIEAATNSLEHVATLALEEPSSTSFKTEEDLEIGDKRIIVYLNHLLDYNGKYQILLFDLENHNTNDFTVDHLALTSLTDKAGERNISGYFKCDKRLRGDEINHCSFVTTDGNVLDGDRLKLSVSNGRGQGAVTW